LWRTSLPGIDFGRIDFSGTVETIRQDTIYALESVIEPVVAKACSCYGKIAESSQQDMDALVANVLAKDEPGDVAGCDARKS